MSRWNSPSLLCKKSCWRQELQSPPPPVLSKPFCKSYFLSFCCEFVLQLVSGALIQTFCLKTFRIFFLSFICSPSSVAALLWFPKNIRILRESAVLLRGEKWISVRSRSCLHTKQHSLESVQLSEVVISPAPVMDRPMFSRKYTPPNLSPNERCSPALVGH